MEDIFDKLQAVTGISKYSNSEVITPQNIIKDMVDLLPTEIFNPDAKFLDPAVKSGRFLIEIYHRLMHSPLLDHIPEPDRQKHIIENQLYGLATSLVAATVTRKALYGNPLVTGNIVYIDQYLTLMANKGTDFRKLIEKEFGQMKFDVVIGNPPYQDGSQSIYQRFIDKALDIYGTHICMITKNNWLTSDTLKQTRCRMIDAGITDIINYPVAYEIFADASPSVSIFKISKNGCNVTKYCEIREGNIVSSYEQNIRGMPVILGDRLEQSIIWKIKDHITEDNFGSRTYPDECFRINSNGTVGRGASKYELQSVSNKTDDYNIAVVYMDSSRKP